MEDRAGPVVGSAEIARMLGVSRQRVGQLVSSRDFPEPYATLDMGRVWKTSDVEQWAHRRGRILQDP